MSCLITSGYTLPCKGISGIQAVYIGNWNGTAMTYIYGSASNPNEITAFGGTTQSFYTFQQEIETGSLTETGNFNPQNGTAYYDQVVEITVYNITQPLIDQVNNLGRGRWRIIVLDSNGNYFLIGKVNPVNVSAVAGGPGKAFADVNGFTITFTGKEYDVLTQITSSAAASVIS